MQIPIRVYIEDTDAGGIVYYVNYLKFMERARTEYMRHLGYGKAAFFADQLMIVVHSLNVSYCKPAHLDDSLMVSAEPVKVGKVAVVFEQKVYLDDQLLCLGEVKVACVRRKDQKPAALPTLMYQQLRQRLRQ
jgi:4-hydroxybenzoyl-CoA thioesterase/acyl-CoA thioester hydrolase